MNQSNTGVSSARAVSTVFALDAAELLNRDPIEKRDKGGVAGAGVAAATVTGFVTLGVSTFATAAATMVGASNGTSLI